MGAIEWPGTTLAESNSNKIKNGIILCQNYPNPFNPITTIRFSVPATTHVKLTIYDLLGSEMKTLVNHELIAGEHNIEWNAITHMLTQQKHPSKSLSGIHVS